MTLDEGAAMYWPSGRLGRRLGVACFVAVVVVVGLVVAFELPQWVWFVAYALSALGASMYVGKGGYGGRKRDHQGPSTRP